MKDDGKERSESKHYDEFVGRVLAGALPPSAWLGLPSAQQQSVAPGINQRFLEGQNFGEFIDQFEREGREIFDNRHAILKEIALKPGMTVADIGAGSGLFTQLFAREVGPSGKVYALEINPDHGEQYRAPLARRGPPARRGFRQHRENHAAARGVA